MKRLSLYSDIDIILFGITSPLELLDTQVILLDLELYFSSPLLIEANQIFPSESLHIEIISLLNPNYFSLVNPPFSVHDHIAFLVPIQIVP